jgi:large subunit ribosomal protein L19
MAEEKNQTEAVSAEEPQSAPIAPAVATVASADYVPELRDDIPALGAGDEVKVYYRVIEGGKERIQIYEGTVIALKNSGVSRTVTVRKTSFGIAVERIFPVHSKLVQKIEVKKHSKVRRAKLYYLRQLKGKAARLKEIR